MCHAGSSGLVKAQLLPSDGLIADATPANLPNPHDRVVFLREPDSMNFDQSRIAVILEFKEVP